MWRIIGFNINFSFGHQYIDAQFNIEIMRYKIIDRILVVIQIVFLAIVFWNLFSSIDNDILIGGAYLYTAIFVLYATYRSKYKISDQSDQVSS